MVPASSAPDCASVDVPFVTVNKYARAGMPIRLRDLGIPKGDIPGIAAETVKNFNANAGARSAEARIEAAEMVPGQTVIRSRDNPIATGGGLVFSGAWDGMLRALSTQDGKLLWEFDTAKDFTTINWVAGKGGSMGAAGPVMAGKHLLVPSGYVGVKNGLPGNVLLMFRP